MGRTEGGLTRPPLFMAGKSPWFTIDQAADYMQMSRGTVKSLLRLGRIPYAKSGRLVRINVADIDHYFEEQIAGTAAAQNGSMIDTTPERNIEKTAFNR